MAVRHAAIRIVATLWKQLMQAPVAGCQGQLGQRGHKRFAVIVDRATAGTVGDVVAWSPLGAGGAGQCAEGAAMEVAVEGSLCDELHRADGLELEEVHKRALIRGEVSLQMGTLSHDGLYVGTSRCDVVAQELE